MEYCCLVLSVCVWGVARREDVSFKLMIIKTKYKGTA